MSNKQSIDLIVLYAHFSPEENPEGHQWASDIRHFARPEMITQKALDVAYRRVIDTTVTYELSDLIGGRLTEKEDISDRDIALIILEEIWTRMQGPNVDSDIGYHGAMCRSMCVGDIVFLNGDAWMADRFGFTYLENLEV